MPEHVLLVIKKSPLFVSLGNFFHTHFFQNYLYLFPFSLSPLSLSLSHTQADHLNKTRFYIHSRQGFLPKCVPLFFLPPRFFLYTDQWRKHRKIWGLWGDRWTRCRGKLSKWCCKEMTFTGRKERIFTKVKGIPLFLFDFFHAGSFIFKSRQRSCILDIPDSSFLDLLLCLLSCLLVVLF